MWFNENITDGLKISHAIVNFMPSWWYHNFGIEYGRKMIFDPDYREEAYLAMRRTFYDEFGREIGAGTNDPKPQVILPDFDNTFYQSMMGFDVRFPLDQYPMAEGCLTDAQIDSLNVPSNLWDVYPYNEVARQIHYMNNKLNTDFPLQMKTRGVLNECVQMCSSDFYCDLLDEDCDEKTRKLLEFVTGVLRQQIDRNHKVNPGFEHIMMNCTAAIAGAPTYKERVYQYDWALYQYCCKNNLPIGLHHCGNFDSFVSIYAPMKELDFIEIGHESAIRPVLEQYPNAHVQYIISTNLISNGTVSEIRDKMIDVLEQSRGHWDRFSVSAADLEYGMPNDNVIAMVEALKK